MLELARYVDSRLREIAGAGAASTESHLMVLTALVMADEIFDMRDSQREAALEESRIRDALNESDERMIVEAINHLAARIDSVADRLQKN